MPRYILIDNNSRYIFGDTADFNGEIYAASGPEDAARELDERVVKEYGRTYTLYTEEPSLEVDGYWVYRADVRGSEAVPLVDDGRSQKMTNDVVRNCEFVGFVKCSRPTES